MEANEIIKKVQKIAIRTRGISKQLFSGDYHSAFKGRGMSFSEVREYYYGDDVRNIDWNVTARTGTPYVKVFEEERELTVMLIVDISKSVQFGTGNKLKSETIAEICAVLAYSAANNNDKVGLILFSDKVHMYIPPKKGRQHTLRLIRELIFFDKNKTGTTDLSKALEFLNNVTKKRSICFVVSDFITPAFETPLRIASRRHDVIAINLYDKLEAGISDVGMLRIMDAETGSSLLVDTSDPVLRDHLSKRFSAKLRDTKSNITRCGADYILMNTDESYIQVLLKFFKHRSGKK